jgi:hypothetical protein
MNLHGRIKYHVLHRFQNTEVRRRWDVQYMQWISEGYSRLVQCEMIFLFILYSILQLLLPSWAYNSVIPYLHKFSGISPEMYRIYKRRYLNPWDPAHIHVRVMIRYCPWLIPKSKRRAVYNRYKAWQAQLSRSPSSTLHTLVMYFEAWDVDPKWYRNVKNLVEFTIWVRGRIEKPFHLHRYGQWELKAFPDPKYKDPVRYALAASIMEQLVDVFNWRIERGIRRDYVQTGWETMVGRRWDLEYPPPQSELVPLWTKRVPPSPIPLVISSGYSGNGLSYDEVLAIYDDVDKPNAHF